MEYINRMSREIEEHLDRIELLQAMRGELARIARNNAGITEAWVYHRIQANITNEIDCHFVSIRNKSQAMHNHSKREELPF